MNGTCSILAIESSLGRTQCGGIPLSITPLIAWSQLASLHLHCASQLSHSNGMRDLHPSDFHCIALSQGNEHRVRQIYVASMVFNEMIRSDAIHKTLGSSCEGNYKGYSDTPSSIVVRLILHWLSEWSIRRHEFHMRLDHLRHLDWGM